MPELSEVALQAMRHELTKHAAGLSEIIQRIKPNLRGAGALGGVGGLLGGAGGAAVGGLRGYQNAREQGAGVEDALLGGAGSALRGGMRGALVGGAVGTGVGALAGSAASPGWLAQRGGPIGAAARFGQRQVHSLTGVLSPSELEGVRGGAFDARAALGKAQGKFDAAKNTSDRLKETHDAASFAQKAIDPKHPNAAQYAKDFGDQAAQIANKQKAVLAPATKMLGRAQRSFDAAHASQEMGLTSIPGYVSAVKEHGLGKVLGISAREQLRGVHPAMAGAMVGLPAVGVAHAALSKEAPDGEGPGRGEMIGKNLGQAVGGLVGGAVPLAGQLVMGGALERAGKTVGKGIDRLRGRHPGRLGPPDLEPVESQNMPSERVMSPSAAGQQNDVGI